VYPKVQAKAIAETTKDPLLSAEVKPAEPPEELIETEVVTVAPEPKPVEFTEAAPEPAPQEIAEATPPPAPVSVQELPKTGSATVAIGLAGLLMTAAGFGLRRLGLRRS
jgi:LPXTG-motif cell wall-anchored protein